MGFVDDQAVAAEVLERNGAVGFAAMRLVFPAQRRQFLLPAGAVFLFQLVTERDPPGNGRVVFGGQLDFARGAFGHQDNVGVASGHPLVARVALVPACVPRFFGIDRGDLEGGHNGVNFFDPVFHLVVGYLQKNPLRLSFLTEQGHEPYCRGGFAEAGSEGGDTALFAVELVD